MVIAGIAALVCGAFSVSGRPLVQIITLCLMACVLGYASYRDMEAFTIPNGCVLALMGIWLAGMAGAVLSGAGTLDAAAPTSGGAFVEGVFSALIPGVTGAFVSAGLSFAIAFFYKRFTGRASLGMGDVKLYFATGLFLGFSGALLNLVLSSFLGLVFAAVWQRAARGESGQAASAQNGQEGSVRHAAFPFGPAIALSTCILLLL